MRDILRTLSTFLFLMTLFNLNSAWAVQVKEIKTKTSELVLDDGRAVKLAGIHLESESQKQLEVIFAGQDVVIEETKLLPQTDGVLFVYVWFNQKQLSLPFPVNATPNSEKVLVNELLLSLGAANVDETVTFDKKDAFMRVQAKAKEEGKGIWSFEPFPVKKKSKS